MYTQIAETIFSDEFVSPELSATLYHMGITNKVPYSFKIGKDFCIPFTYEFDTENIYRQMDANVFITGGVATIPAYRIKDLERVFESYSFNKKGTDHYQVSTTIRFKNYSASSERMPDVFACLIIQILQGKITTVKEVNERILVV